jgi:cytochrome c oxidase subunit 2
MSVGHIPIFQHFSPETASMAHLFTLVLLICGIILLVVIGIIGAGLICFRERPGAGEPRPYFGNRKLELLWTLGPILIVIWLFILTARGMHESDPAANREPDLIVIGHQWWWEVRYPGSGVVTANEIHFPVGQQWLVHLQSADVIHNFWVPALARKMQMIPGMTNHIWLEADAPGTYGGTCAEFCGAGHSWMHFSVIAESPAAFAAWLHRQEGVPTNTVPETARDGRKLFQTLTCINCHSLRGVSATSGIAPDLTSLADRKTVGAGVLSNTETNLFRWLKNPQAIKRGCLMPDLKLTDAQAGSLAAYLEARP